MNSFFPIVFDNTLTILKPDGTLRSLTEIRIFATY